jgi:hypothetical protein
MDRQLRAHAEALGIPRAVIVRQAIAEWWARQDTRSAVTIEPPPTLYMRRKSQPVRYLSGSAAGTVFDALCAQPDKTFTFDDLESIGVKRHVANEAVRRLVKNGHAWRVDRGMFRFASGPYPVSRE